MLNRSTGNAVEEDAALVLVECGEGSTMDAVSLRCRPCALCGRHQHVRRPCEATRDTRCECDRDFYVDDGAVDGAQGGCRACDLCPHGWGAHAPCTQHRNSVCRKCQAGTYSSLLSAQLACFPCSVCRKQQTTLHNCTRIQDTVCAEARELRVAKGSSTTKGPKGPNPAHLNFLAEEQSVWPIYSALLLTLLAAILAYFLLKRWHKPRPSPKATPIAVLTQAPPPLFRDVCRSKRRALETMLDDERHAHWRHLALALGYEAAKIKEMEGKPKSSSRRLLNDWACSRPLTSDLGTLQAALGGIGRRDIVELLWSAHAHTCLCAERALCNCFRNKFDKHLLRTNTTLTVDIL